MSSQHHTSSSLGASSFANRRFAEYEQEKQRNEGIASSHQQHLLTSSNHNHYNYVSNEEFALLKRSIERDRAYRDDVIYKLKNEVAELRNNRNFEDQQQDQSSMLAGGSNTNYTSNNKQHTSSSSSYVLMSSPPKKYGIFGNKSFQSSSNTNHTQNQTTSRHDHHDEQSASPEEQLSHHLTLQSRIEHLESINLALPSQMEALEEKCRTIVEERMKQIHHASQLSNLLNKIDSLTEKQESMEVIQTDISNMLEHDVARNAPIKQNLDEVKLDAALLKKEVDTLHSQRLASEDVRVKLENEVRALRTHVAELETVLSGKLELEVAKLGSTRESLTESLIERKMAMERDAMKDFVRREIHRVREESLDAQNQMRVEMMQQQQHNASSNSIYNSSIPSVQHALHLQQQHNQSGGNNNDTSNHNINNISNISTNNHQHDALQDGADQQKLFTLLSEQIQTKGRQIEANLNAALGDSNRNIESKLATRIREQAEANRAMLSEELSKHLDEQFDVILNTAKEDLRHNLAKQIDEAMKRESDKLMRTVLQQSNGQTSDQLRRHQDEILRLIDQQKQQQQVRNNNSNNNSNLSNNSNANNNNNNVSNFAGPNEGAADLILDGVELFVREALSTTNHQKSASSSSSPFISLNPDNEQTKLFAQCLDLVSECRGRNEYSNRGTTGVNDALLLLWKFLRGHLAGFNMLAESVVANMDHQNHNQRRSSDNNTNNNNSASAENQEHEQRILNTVFDDLDVVVTQLSQANDSFSSCAELLEQVNDDIRLQQHQQRQQQLNLVETGVSSAQLIQLLWMFMRGNLSLVTMMGESIGDNSGR